VNKPVLDRDFNSGAPHLGTMKRERRKVADRMARGAFHQRIVTSGTGRDRFHTTSLTFASAARRCRSWRFRFLAVCGNYPDYVAPLGLNETSAAAS
jgi:hypothetical protein